MESYNADPIGVATRIGLVCRCQDSTSLSAIKTSIHIWIVYINGWNWMGFDTSYFPDKKRIFFFRDWIL